MAPWVRVVDTSSGPARVLIARSDRPVATLALGHGVGSGVDTRDLVSLVRVLPPRGVSVVRVMQPWLVAGKKIAPGPGALDEAWVTAISTLRGRVPLVVGGRSAGARVACRTARKVGAVGCVALAFPLHPPGRPEDSRADELLGTGVPTLIVQGERDPWGSPYELPFGADVTVVPGADHSFAVSKGVAGRQALPHAGGETQSAPLSQVEAVRLITDSVLTWIHGQVAR